MRHLIALAAVAAAVVLAAGCGGDDTEAPDTTQETTTTETTTESTTQTTTAEASVKTIRIVVAGGLPSGGIKRPSVDKSDRVVLVVRSDVADEVHVHGYDLMKDVEAGKTVRIPFTATIPGRFEVELESRGLQLAEITVNP
jgi:hypothetical protein